MIQEDSFITSERALGGNMPEDEDQKTAGDAVPAGGVLGPFWELFKVAKDVHPLVPYAVVILLLIVTGGLMLKFIAPYTGDFGPIRTIIYVFLLVFFLMAFFATFAEFFVGTQSSWKARLPRILLLVLLGGGGIFGAFQVANAKPENCSLVSLLAGPKIAEKCTVAPDPPEVVLSGRIDIADRPFMSFIDAQAKIVIGAATMPTPVSKEGSFSGTAPKKLIGHMAEAIIEIPNIGMRRMKQTISADGAEFIFEIAANEVPGGVTLTRTASATTVAPKIDGAPVTNKAQLRSDAFSGGGLQYTLFFCQAPDGDPVASRTLAAQLKTVLDAQTGVTGSEIRAWPASTNAGYSNLTRNAVLINQPANGSRDVVSADLQKLWSAYVPAGVTVRPRFVSTAYAKLTAVICV